MTLYEPEAVSQNRHYVHLENDYVPWSPPAKPLAESKVALVTMGGLHLPSQPPFNDEDNRGDPDFRELPRDLRNGDFLVSHSHYNHEWVQADLNCLLPLEMFLQLEHERVIGELAEVHYSFMGSIPNPLALVTDTGPEVARRMRERDIDLCILTPT